MHEIMAFVANTIPIEHLLDQMKEAIQNYQISGEATQKEALDNVTMLYMTKLHIERAGGFEKYLDQLQLAKTANDIMNNAFSKTQS